MKGKWHSKDAQMRIEWNSHSLEWCRNLVQFFLCFQLWNTKWVASEAFDI